MELKERIHNIKELLSYCDNEEFETYNKDIGKFFKELFSQDKFHHHMYFDAGVSIGLYLKTVAYIPTMYIRYIYEYDREGSDDTLVLFNDDEAKYKHVTSGGYGAYGDRNSQDGHGDLEYSDIPDWVWEKIQQGLYEKVKVKLAKKVEDSKEWYLHRAKEAYEYDLNQYNKLVGKYETEKG